MKKILCYGDSNTFGYNPKNGGRYDEKSRWSAILKENLSNNFQIIEEGLNNRTGFAESPDGFKYSGSKHLSYLLDELSDIEILILAIGTNDFQFRYNISEKIIEEKLSELLNKTIDKKIKTIVISPVELQENILKSNFSFLFNEDSINKSKKLIKTYEKVSFDKNCAYLNFNRSIKPSSYDGLHYEKEAHLLIAQKLSEVIFNLITD